jgi:hypothetical protein
MKSIMRWMMVIQMMVCTIVSHKRIADHTMCNIYPYT